MKLPLVGSPIYVEDVFIMLLLMIAVMILQPVYKPSPVPASHCFISLLMMVLTSPLLSSLSSQQIAKTLLMFFTWCEGKSCNPSGNPVVTRLGPARSQVTVMSPARDCLAVLCIATRQHITANWQYTFQSDNANLIFIVKYANFLRAGKLQSNININLPILFCDKL